MKLIGRRNFLASMGLGPGAYLLGSIFNNSLLPEALGAPPKKHFFLLSRGQGWLEDFYACRSRSETDFDLSESYEPLYPHKNQLVLASSFYNPVDRQQHGNAYAFLSVTPSPIRVTDVEFGVPGGITIDRAIGKALGAADAYPAISFWTAHFGQVSLSADGPRQPAFNILGPAAGFDRLFGTGSPAAVERTQRTAVLDLIAKDVTRMNGRLAGPEKAKLDQYLTSLQGLERRVEALAGRVTCVKPAKPPASFQNPPEYFRPEIVDATVDLAFHAHLCGLTHVSHVALPTMEGHPQLDFLRTPDEMNVHDFDASGFDLYWDVHEVMHRGDMSKIMRVQKFNNGRVALLLDLLSKAKDPGGAGGSMLDNSLVASIDFCGGFHHGGQDTFRVLMAGKAGGAVKTGRYLTYPQGSHCISDVFTSWANTMGVNMEKFGVDCQGPLPGLLG